MTFTEIDAPADYTQKSLNGVRDSLLEGIVLTAIVLMFFLHAWRNAVVVMIAIPSSLLATLIVMQLLHFTLDIVSLMGLSLIIGILVDDSIVVLENITRHRDMGERPLDAAIKGRGEIGGAAVAITLVDVVVFLPIAFLSGIVGKFMVEFGIVVVVATLFSLLVSFTLTPMLAARWSVKKRSAAPPRALAWFQTRVRPVYAVVSRRRVQLHHQAPLDDRVDLLPALDQLDHAARVGVPRRDRYRRHRDRDRRRVDVRAGRCCTRSATASAATGAASSAGRSASPAPRWWSRSCAPSPPRSRARSCSRGRRDRRRGDGARPGRRVLRVADGPASRGQRAARA